MAIESALKKLSDDLITADHFTSELGSVIARLTPGRTARDEIPRFKSVGLAVQDVAPASAVLAAAQEMDLGSNSELF